MNYLPQMQILSKKIEYLAIILTFQFQEIHDSTHFMQGEMDKWTNKHIIQHRPYEMNFGK